MNFHVYIGSKGLQLGNISQLFLFYSLHFNFSHLLKYYEPSPMLGVLENRMMQSAQTLPCQSLVKLKTYNSSNHIIANILPMKMAILDCGRS
jgi:hypothetical protein